MKYAPALAQFYIKWFHDCRESVIYCRRRNDEIRAKKYLEDSLMYLTIIMENWDEITKVTNWDKITNWGSEAQIHYD